MKTSITRNLLHLVLLGAGLLLASIVNAQVSFSSTTYPVGYFPSCVVAADINNDGKLDLIIANSDILPNGTAGNSGNSLTVLTNNGVGSFGFNATLTVGTNPWCVTAADVNGDGKMDLISANVRDNTLTVLTNNGNGGFGLDANLATANRRGYPFWVVAADINDDGKPALISANFFGNTLSVLTNDGGGNFGSNATINVGGNPDFVTAVDANGDGKQDLIGVNSASPPFGWTLSIYTNNGSGGFGSNSTVYAGWNPKCVVPIDIKGIGKPDLVVADNNPAQLTILTNNGSGVFGSNATLTVDSYANFVTATDINGDGRMDLVVACGGNTLEVLTNNGNGGFGYNASINVGNAPSFVMSADVDGDGKPDLICVNTYSGIAPTVTVLLNTSPFPPPTSTPNLNMKYSSNHRVYASWPSASAGWSLQQSSDLTTSNWNPSGYNGYPISDDGTNKSLTVQSPRGNLFFRLLHP